MDFYYKEELIQLLPQKVAFLPHYQMLIIADLHLGKASHFRKEGIMIPVPSVSPDLQRMQELIISLKPTTVVFLGDLFHSRINKEWEGFKDFLNGFPAIHFVLTRGNHDILPKEAMNESPIEVVEELSVGKNILLTHDAVADGNSEVLTISGHIHPGVLIKGKGRQSFRLPCFYHSGQTLILPAFGKLTGLFLMEKIAGSSIYPIFSDEVVKLP